MREPPELILRRAQHVHRLGQGLDSLGGDVPGRTVQGKMHGGEELPRLVMKLLGDPPTLSLLGGQGSPATLAPFCLEPLQHLVESTHERPDLGWARDRQPLARPEEIHVSHPPRPYPRGRLYLVDVASGRRRGPIARVDGGLGYYGYHGWAAATPWFQVP